MITFLLIKIIANNNNNLYFIDDLIKFFVAKPNNA